MVSVVCGGGATSPKLTTSTYVDVGAAALGVALTEAGYSWLVPAIPLLNLLPIAPATFCASDPPAQPTFTTAETTALLQLTFGADFTSALAKLTTLAQNVVWWQLCQCNNGTRVSAPAPIAPPSNTPVPLSSPSPGASAPCQGGNNGNNPCGVSLGALITSGNTLVNSGPGSTNNATSVDLTYQFHRVNGASGAKHFTVIWCTPTDCLTPVYYELDTIPFLDDGLSHTVRIPIPAAAGGFNISLFWSANSTDTFDSSYVINCGSVQSPGCCPADPILIALLQQIISLLTTTNPTSTTLTEGTAHAALSGGGTIAAPGLAGVKVVLTTIPPNVSVYGGTPTTYLYPGTITPYTVEGPMLPIDILRSTQWVAFPDRTLGFDYNLDSGVVATITEVRAQ
jgi:hypothetical protein